MDPDPVSQRVIELAWKNDESLNDAAVNEFPDGIPTIDASIPYSDFFERFLVLNRPCLLTEEFTNNWESRSKWVERCQDNQEGHIAWQFLSSTYGDEKVIVTDCRKEDGQCEPIEMTIREYLQYWQEYKTSNYSSSLPCLYLKDWHLLRCKSSDSQNTFPSFPYTVPLHFKSDWLNEYCNALNKDDFCFCYMGPKGSWTGFHSDVYGSFSWSANIIGRKKWRIYLPNRIQKLFSSNNVSVNNCDVPTTVQYKYDYDNPGEEGIDYFEVVQEAGQVIFVPSGWFHVVWNLEDTISINHNWFNGTNLEFVWKTLSMALNDVELELNDLKNDEEFPNLCQTLLKANHGMNYEEFLDILLFIWERRSQYLAKTTESRVENVSAITESHFAPISAFGLNHVRYDLNCIEKVLKKIQFDVENRKISRRITLPATIKKKIENFRKT